MRKICFPLEPLRRRLITQLRRFSRMLISQNTCEASFLFPLAALKLETSIALKRDQKEARRKTCYVGLHVCVGQRHVVYNQM